MSNNQNTSFIVDIGDEAFEKQITINLVNSGANEDMIKDKLLKEIVRGDKQIIKKYVVLELVNILLEKIGHVRIEDINDFEVERGDLLCINGANFAEENLHLIKFGNITKKDIKYNARNIRKSYIITFLKCIVNSIDLICHSKHIVNGKTSKYDKTIYTIKNA